MNKKIFLAGLLCLASVASVVGMVGNAREVEAATIPSGTNLYFDPCDQWKNNMINNGGGKERYAAYFYGGAGEKWISMTDSNSDGIWEVTTTQNQGNVIFCAMNPGNSTLAWSAKWNQTSDLTYDGVNNLYIQDGDQWDKGAGHWEKYVEPGEEIKPFETLTGIVSKYSASVAYIRDTSINIDMTDEDVKKDLISAFHAKAIETERTTYFDGDQLWMTNANGVNSGYGTSASGMTHFTYKEGKQTVDSTVSGTTMEDYYTTLKDIIISEDQNWEVKDSVYSSKDKTLIQKFLDFTAPCFLNTADKNVSNIFSLDHVEIEESNRKLLLRLYVQSDSEGFIKDGTTLLSTATITSLTPTALPGTFNGWDTGKDIFHQTDVQGKIYAQVTLTAGEQKFKVLYNNEWVGKSQITVSGITATNDTDDNIVFKAEAATYLFEYNASNKKLNVTKI